MNKSAKNKKPVYLYNIDGDFVMEFNSINECANFLGRKHCTILSAINRKSLINKKYMASFDKLKDIKAYINNKSESLSKKLKNNRNCATYYWRLTDKNKVYVEDGIRKLSLTSGYKQDILRCIAYNRVGYKQYKDFLKIEKLNKYDKC